MHALVYLLCAATTFACAVLLFRGYRRSQARLLLWSTVFFAAITLENILLFADFVLFPGVDLSWVRLVLALGGVSVLLMGMIAERT